MIYRLQYYFKNSTSKTRGTKFGRHESVLLGPSCCRSSATRFSTTTRQFPANRAPHEWIDKQSIERQINRSKHLEGVEADPEGALERRVRVERVGIFGEQLLRHPVEHRLLVPVADRRELRARECVAQFRAKFGETSRRTGHRVPALRLGADPRVAGGRNEEAAGAERLPAGRALRVRHLELLHGPLFICPVQPTLNPKTHRSGE